MKSPSKVALFELQLAQHARGNHASLHENSRQAGMFRTLDRIAPAKRLTAGFQLRSAVAHDAILAVW
jgi:hypothetical protein